MLYVTQHTSTVNYGKFTAVFIKKTVSIRTRPVLALTRRHRQLPSKSNLTFYFPHNQCQGSVTPGTFPPNRTAPSQSTVV